MEPTLTPAPPPDPASAAAGAPPAPPSPEEARFQLENRLRTGANWFFWIAVLSLINSLASLSGVSWAFIIGLAVTQFIDAIANSAKAQTGNIISIIAFGFDLVIASVFALFGKFAKKKSKAVFLIGMFLYGCDGLLFLVVKDWIGLGFHAFALYCIYLGYKACLELLKLDQEVAAKAMAAGAILG